MFDWFWEFLYGLVKALFQLADAMIYGSKKLCGVDAIEVNGEETDFLSYLFHSQEVSTTFKIAALSGVLVVMFFAVFAIIRSITSQKQETTPIRVLVQTGKTLMMFLFVPAVMLAFMWICNEFITVLNVSMMGSGDATLGSFLFTTCAEDAWYGEPSTDFVDGIANYANTAQVSSYISLKNFNYMLGIIAGIAILLPIASMLIMFVDRAISIVLLFIVSPYSISTNVVDDGSHFKLWRDQVLIKFLTGYGCIIALNIYAIIIKLVISNSVVFFPTTGAPFLPVVSNSFLNSLMKMAIIVGGAFSLQKIMAVIGNLVSAGAGSNELRDVALAGSSMGRYFTGIGRLGGGILRGGIGGIGKLAGLGLNKENPRGTFRDRFKYGNLTNGTPAAARSEESPSENKFSGSPLYSMANASGNGRQVENIINNGSSQNNNLLETPSRGDNERKTDAVSSAIINGRSTNNMTGDRRRSNGSIDDDLLYDEDLK